MRDTTVCIVGTGYVGMACLIGLAELGWTVHGYDILPERIARLRLGITPYKEHGIEKPLAEHLQSGRIRFYDSLPEACAGTDIVIITVGTPCREDGSADLTAVYAATEQLARIPFESKPTIVLRSTVPPGTSDALAGMMRSWANFLYAPEFLREGTAIHDFLNPDRIVVGAENVEQALPYARLFESLGKPVILTSPCNAELIKCCSNAFLALKISFANEVANLCDVVGATADDVLRGVGYDRRIGADFLRPGIGFGGPCFEKDVKSINSVAAGHGLPGNLFAATLRVNEEQPQRIVSLLENRLHLGKGVRIGVWGLAFKAGTDDVRDSLAMRIVEQIARRGASVIAYDPAVRVASLPDGATIVSSPIEATNADALVVLTDWPEFASLAPSRYARNIKKRFLIDGRNILDPQRVQAAGLVYAGVGRHFAADPLSHEALEVLSV